MLKKWIKIFGILVLIMFMIILGINLIVIGTTRNKIISLKDANQLKEIDCILILGAGIKGNYPSPMLEDRLLQGISLYNQNVSSKIIASGDHMSKNYDEVNVMKDYLVGHKIPSQDVFMDHAGISTYDSIYRTKYIFNAKKIIIVTQEYHLYRALYIAKSLGLNAYGVSSNKREYKSQEKRELREIIARVKDFFKSLLEIPSTYLGEEISLTGNGDFTNDK